MSDIKIGVKMEMVKIIDEADREIAKLNVELVRKHEILGRFMTFFPPVIKEQIDWTRKEIEELTTRINALTLRRTVFAQELGYAVEIPNNG